MNRPALFVLLFLVSATLLVQSSAASGTQSAVLHLPPASTACPVGMRAQHVIGQGAVVAVRGSHHAGQIQGNHHVGPPVQQIELTLSNSKPKDIVGAEITVHGFNGKGHMTLARSGQAEPSEITKTIKLKLTVGGKEDASADLSLDAFSAVDLVDLDSISYADGSTWRSSDLQTCHVVPDGMMLLSSR